jgi:hypothetical protein
VLSIYRGSWMGKCVWRKEVERQGLRTETSLEISIKVAAAW